jgi:hypothetical protein
MPGNRKQSDHQTVLDGVLRQTQYAIGERSRRRLKIPATETGSPCPGVMLQPPPADIALPLPGSFAVAARDAGEERKACVSPDPVSPEPATCPRSLMLSASVAPHPG